MRGRTWSGVAVGLALWGAGTQEAGAFCGFYVSGSGEQLLNNATEVALMRDGTRTVLTMSNHYQGPAQDFAMVVPVPIVLREQNVKTLDRSVFDRLDQLTAPRLVEYWEIDPCYVEPPEEVERDYSRRRPRRHVESTAIDDVDEPHVRIEAQFTVGEYQVVVLSADQSNALETWLHENHYNIPPGAATVLEPYVRDQSKFFVAKVDIQKVRADANGVAELSPLRFHYDSPDFRLPVRLGLLNAQDAQDLVVYVLGRRKRYEVTNYTNIFIPTNLEVDNSVRASFGPFYNRLFDATLAAANVRAVVTEYSWSAMSCDPCPVPSLSGSELQTLGSDVVSADNAGNPVMNPYEITVTRLHTRYNSATLTEDLVFREAPAVVGGREFVRDANGGIEQGAQVLGAGQQSNFQARYIIRHPWEGAVRCRHPVRGRWGGPPGSGPGSAPQSRAASNLGTTARSDLELTAIVKTPTPGVDLAARLVFPPPVSFARTTAGTDADAGAADAGAAADAQGATSGGSTRPAANRGCACATAGAAPSRGGLAAWLGALAGLLGLRRRSARGAGPRALGSAR